MRIVSSETSPDETLESAVVLVESTTRDTVRPPPTSARQAPLSRWSDLDVALQVDTLALYAPLATVDAARAATLHGVITEVGDVRDALRALSSRHSDSFSALLQHAYEWASNIVRRSEALASARNDYDDLPVEEYSSLFVRAILDPMIDAAIEIELRTARNPSARSESAVAALTTLRERIVWLNWTVKRLAL